MIGQHLAHYEIVELLGEGGMGAVYRARDSKLGRDVAIKVLNERTVENDDARARFEREARAVAALSHPNILAIHDFGEHEGTVYAVTELLEGQSLHDRLRQGPLPLRSALDLGAQIADGLAAAHDKGIVHRDLKPANVFVTPDGRAKILDFGLAKAHGPLAGDDTIGATVAARTSPGTVLGTVRYMSPEQVRGEDVDARSDIFSFGTLLWEMLTGRVAFDRSSAADSMSAILNEDLEELSTDDERVPPLLDRIIHRCVEKQPEQRFRTAHDLGFALRSVGDASTKAVAAIDASAPSSKKASVRLFIGGILLAAFLGGAIGASLTGGGNDRAPVKIIPITHSGRDSEPSASPDGGTVAFVSDRDGTQRIWLRDMRGGIEAPLTDGPDSRPDFSPDGSSILFLRQEGDVYSAYRIPLVGGAPRKIIHNVAEARWSPDGTEIAFGRSLGDAAQPESMIAVFDVDTGRETELTRFANVFGYGLAWSPDGRRIATTRVGAVLNSPRNELVVIDRDTETIEIIHSDATRLSGTTWTLDGRGLYFAASTSLLGDISSRLGLVQRIDVGSGDTEPLFWVQSVFGGGGDYVTFDHLGEDRLLFDEILWRGSLTRVSLDGTPPLLDGVRLTQGNARDRQPAFSPDGKSVVFSSNRSGNLDIWKVELETGEIRQLTDDDADDWDPAFNHDGSEILWSSNRGGHLEIWAARADGSGARQISNDGEDAENPTQTPDGAWITYASGHQTKRGIWKMRTDGSEVVQLKAGAFFLPDLSPSGRYVAFVGNNATNRTATIYVSNIDTGDVVWHTETSLRGLQDAVSAGRVRWLPDESGVVFVSSDDGAYAVYRQDFVPGEDTGDSRVLLVVSEPGVDIESLGVSPGGASIVVARFDHYRTLKIAEDYQ